MEHMWHCGYIIVCHSVVTDCVVVYYHITIVLRDVNGLRNNIEVPSSMYKVGYNIATLYWCNNEIYGQFLCHCRIATEIL